MIRRNFLKTSSLATALASLSLLTEAATQEAGKTPARMPVLFIGHGSPRNAILDNPFTQFLQKLGPELPTPTAILVVSAHWLSQGVTGVAINERPATIHDFSGFEKELHEMQYPAPGHPQLAKLAKSMIRRGAAVETNQWGLDHGTWTVLRHLYPNASIPVFQVSINYAEQGDFHLAVGRELAALRDKGVLIVGSGNIVHNLRLTERLAPEGPSSKPWAQEFDDAVKKALDDRDDKALGGYWALSKDAKVAVPTPDHYWPLLYAVGAAKNDGPPKHIFEGFQGGTLSMRCLKFG
ncbi:4,5-DOPA dioxygenase extradiol [Nostoc sp. CHAB 5834]|nr:4,5-DOPA dioxygenase extradiol [Nostoc sp. CHAB 5834]